MATVNLGRVGFVPMGEYSASTQYVKYDTVTYNGSVYTAWATVTGVTPGTDAQKWKLLIDGISTEELNELKSAIDYSASVRDRLFGVENLLDRVTKTSGSQRGVTYTHIGNGVFHVKGTVLSGQTYSQVSIYDGTITDFLEAGETYLVQLATEDSHVILRMYAYNGNGSATDIYGASLQTPQMVTIPSDTVRVLIRLRVDNANTSVDCRCYPAITKTLSNTQLSDLIETVSADAKDAAEGVTSLKVTRDLYGLDNLLDNLQYTTKTVYGIRFEAKGDGLYISGTATDNVNNAIYDGSIPAWMEKEREYRCVFGHTNSGVKMLIYGYDSEDAPSAIFDSTNGNAVFTIPSEIVRLLIRIHIDNGSTVDEIVYPAVTAELTNAQLAEKVETLEQALADTQNIMDNITVSTKTVNGITFEPSGDGIYIHGTATANVNNDLFNSSVPNWIEKGTTYKVQFEHDNSTLKLLVYGYNSNDTASTLYDSSAGDKTMTVPNTVVKIRIRLHVDSGETVDEIVYPVISEQYTNKQLGDMILETEALIPKVCKYNYYSGRLFITLCGDKIYVDAQAYRLFDRNTGTYTPSGNTGTTILDYVSNNANYIHCDINGVFTRTPTFDDDVIATVDQAFVNGIIFGYRKLQTGYIRSGSEFFLNFARTPINAYAAYGSNDVKLSKQGYAFRSAKTVTYQIDGRGSLTFTIEQNDVSIANKKILFIGDSFVARGYMQNYLTQFEPTLQFIGSKDTQHYGFKSEGVSGSRLYYFTESDTSPFWFDGALNLEKYLEEWTLPAPDYVIINSAINHNNYSDQTHGTYLENLNALVNMVKAYNTEKSTNIKIYVTFGANYAMEPGSVYGYPSATRYNEVRRCCNSIYTVSGITVIPVDIALIDELDYTYEDFEYQTTGNTIKVLADCVHPSETTGFKKIAKMIYNYLGQ